MAPDAGWVVGPAQAQLGTVATLDIPEGYRFLNARASRTLLQNLKNPIPRGLAGMLAPVEGKWFALFEYVQPGYIKATKEDTIDANAVIAVVQERLKNQNVDRARMAQAPIRSVAWDMEPVFDADQKTIEWAYRAETISGSVVNHTVRLLTRRGYLDVTAVQASRTEAQPVPLKDLMSHVTVLEGERHADFMRGDDIAKLTLTELVTFDGRLPQRASLFSHPGFWAGAAGAMILAAGMAAILIVRRAKREKSMRSTNGNGAHPNGSYRSESQIGVWKMLAIATGFNRRPNSRRTFNYHKYYSDLMSKVSYGAYGAVPYINGGRSRRNGETPSDARNGHAASPVQTSHQMPLFNSPDLIGELIANQKALIEEQKRLLQQQTKLIDEKTRLIEEKSKMMEQQSELIGSNLL